jgi:Domain of unknown function (DUF4153)
MEGLPVILLASVIQGGVLYWLHHAIKGAHWPATDQAWLMALYALAVFVPLTIQLMAERVRDRAMWRLVALLGAAFFYFGWQYGNTVSSATDRFNVTGECFPLALLLSVLWLMSLPFAQSRLAAGHWRVPYHSLFAHAWRNKLMLAEAGLFTGLFWLLLFLWQTLFHTLGIEFFRELFEEPIFVYPVTSLAFGCALHLIGSIERLTSVVLEQLLNVLKWLALLAGVILGLFTLTLIFKLPGMLATGQKAIGAAWLLWLVAVTVLLLNAAYRDGSVPLPYPKWIAQFLKVLVPLTVVITLTALYALVTRTRHYGLTVERVWAFVVAGAALIYSVGYSISAFRGGTWLAGIARVNVTAALALIAVISAALTPLMSPYRLAADSQYRQVLQKGAQASAADGSTFGSPLNYLRFDSGKYGLAKLQELAHTQNGPDADRIRLSAQQELAKTRAWEQRPAAESIPESLAKLRIYPAGRTLDQDLSAKLGADLRKPLYYFRLEDPGMAGIYIDLNGDQSEEFVLANAARGLVYERRAGQWALAATIDRHSAAALNLNAELEKGNYAVSTPKWNELLIGGQVFGVRSIVAP